MRVINVKFSSNIILLLEQLSNLQIQTYFYVKYSLILQTVNLYVKQSPIPYDKPEINFRIRLYDETIPNQIPSLANINIKIFYSGLQTVTEFAFVKPETTNMVLLVNYELIFNYSILYQFQTTKPSLNSVVFVRILNPNLGFLIIDGNYLRVVFPLPNLMDLDQTVYTVSEQVLKFSKF